MRTKQQIQSYLGVLKERKKKLTCKDKSLRRTYFTKMFDMNRALNKMREKERNFKDLVLKTTEFFGEDVKESKNKFYGDIFCRFALENGVKPSTLSKYFNYKGRNHKVAYRRKRAIKSIEVKENKELWEEYKSHLKM